MINGVYLSTMGAITESVQHAITANNLANANTTGFKPNIATFKELLSENVLQAKWRPEENDLLNKTGGGVWVNDNPIAFTPGSVRQTGNALNAAISENNGFFIVKKDGEKFLTRDGSFTLNSLGQLATSDGQGLILDEGGSPINLNDTSGRVHIRNDGGIINEETGETIAKLALVQAKELNKVRKMGDNLFTYTKDEVTNGGLTIEGGAIEQSAVNPITEMVRMIESTRAYQANMKFISIQDESLGRTVNTVGSVK